MESPLHFTPGNVNRKPLGLDIIWLSFKMVLYVFLVVFGLFLSVVSLSPRSSVSLRFIFVLWDLITGKAYYSTFLRSHPTHSNLN